VPEAGINPFSRGRSPVLGDCGCFGKRPLSPSRFSSHMPSRARTYLEVRLWRFVRGIRPMFRRGRAEKQVEDRPESDGISGSSSVAPKKFCIATERKAWHGLIGIAGPGSEPRRDTQKGPFRRVSRASEKRNPIRQKNVIGCVDF